MCECVCVCVCRPHVAPRPRLKRTRCSLSTSENWLKASTHSTRVEPEMGVVRGSNKK